MSDRRRIPALLVFALALVVILLLASSLAQVRLPAGKPFPFNLDPFGMPVDLQAGKAGQVVLAVFRYFYLAAIVLAPIGVIYLLLSPQARKRFLRDLLRLLAFLLFAYGFARVLSGFRPSVQPSESEGGGESGMGILPPQAELTFRADPPEWLIYVASGLLALLISGVVAWFAWRFWRSRRRSEAPMTRIVRQAQAALDALQTGEDLRSTIIRCYAEMSRALQQGRGLRRDQAMTAREFESELVHQGFPAAPVHQLTALFEAVRYSPWEPDETHTQQAVDSLTAIIATLEQPA
jgi:hypothetical protein